MPSSFMLHSPVLVKFSSRILLSENTHRKRHFGDPVCLYSTRTLGDWDRPAFFSLGFSDAVRLCVGVLLRNRKPSWIMAPESGTLQTLLGYSPLSLGVIKFIMKCFGILINYLINSLLFCVFGVPFPSKKVVSSSSGELS